MTVNKESNIETNRKADEKELEKINKLSRRKLGADEVYTFKVRLCDNELDRDGEAFTIGALKSLKDLFTGKTGIMNHEAKAENQLARIYDTWIEEDPKRISSLGEAYTCLMASAYIPRTEENNEIIERIDTGILKEVSVSCAVEKVLCAECGAIYGECDHHSYKRLDKALDAYEFSFVAVPAQRRAGVTKNYEKGAEQMPAEEKEVVLNKAEHRELVKLAEIGRSVRKSLREEIRKNAGIAQPEISRQLIDTMTAVLSFDELNELNKAYKRLAAEKLPIFEEGRPQTKSERSEFLI